MRRVMASMRFAGGEARSRAVPLADADQMRTRNESAEEEDGRCARE